VGDQGPKSFLDEISVLILTHNEAPNIRRTLDAVRAFTDILVLDSGSTDETIEIVKTFSGVRMMTRSFDSHASQWNYGVSQSMRPWVLALDADYVVPGALVHEIARLAPSPSIGGYRASFRYVVCGRPLRGALYPPVVVLYRRDSTYYQQDGHTQRAAISGRIEELRTPIDHDDRKPLSRWLRSQQEYAKLEADYLVRQPRARLSRADRIRRMAWPAPILVFFYALFASRCILDGWPGWFYVLQRTLAEIMIALELINRRLAPAAT
jgi:glycosyltransferase involved in cell wall biosynthesis